MLGETIGEKPERTVERIGDHEAVVSSLQGVRLTYAELDAEVERLALGLRAGGVAKGDRVGGDLLRHDRDFAGVDPDAQDDTLAVQVVGVPGAKYGEELCAWVVPREGADVAEEEIRDFCRDSLAHFKVPRYVVFVDTFAMT